MRATPAKSGFRAWAARTLPPTPPSTTPPHTQPPPPYPLPASHRGAWEVRRDRPGRGGDSGSERRPIWERRRLTNTPNSRATMEAALVLVVTSKSRPPRAAGTACAETSAVRSPVAQSNAQPAQRSPRICPRSSKEMRLIEDLAEARTPNDSLIPSAGALPPPSAWLHVPTPLPPSPISGPPYPPPPIPRPSSLRRAAAWRPRPSTPLPPPPPLASLRSICADVNEGLGDMNASAFTSCWNSHVGLAPTQICQTHLGCDPN